MNRINRVTSILIQLQSKKIIPAKEIAQRFNISLRTVYRDIRTLEEAGGYTSALKAPVRCFGNHLSGKRKSWFRTDNDCGGAAILKTRTSRMGTPVGC